MTSTNPCDTPRSDLRSSAVSRILDAWCAQRRAVESKGQPLSVGTMAEIAADVMRAGRAWGPGDTIDRDVDTIWITAELKATRTDDPSWWRINSEIVDTHLLNCLGPVTENQPTTPRTSPAVRTTEGNPVDQVRDALSSAVRVLEHLVDRRGATVTADLSSRCAAIARTCDQAYDALTRSAYPEPTDGGF